MNTEENTLPSTQHADLRPSLSLTSNPKRLTRIACVLSDTLGLTLCLLISSQLYVWTWPNEAFRISIDHQIIMSSNFLLLLSVTTLSLYVFDAYDLQGKLDGLNLKTRFLLAIFFAGVFVIPILYFARGKTVLGDAVGRGILVVTLSLFGLWGLFIRTRLKAWLDEQTKRLRWMVVGPLTSTQFLWKDCLRTDFGNQVKILLPSNEIDNAEEDLKKAVAGNYDDLDFFLKRNHLNGIVVTDIKALEPKMVKRLLVERLKGIRVLELSEFYELTWSKLPIFHIQDSWFTISHGFELLHNPIGLRLKRILDVFLAMILGVIAAPIMLITTALVKLTSRGPAIYSQKRTGKHGEPFMCYKFRSMCLDAEKDGPQWSQKNDTRITTVGRFIRKTRIDELPQIYNVFRGDMSFIGPRPERPEIIEALEKEIPHYNYRHLVRPGITGWAQIMYPYGSCVEDSAEKLQYDLYYIKNYSIFLDFAILIRTIRVVLFGAGR